MDIIYLLFVTLFYFVDTIESIGISSLVIYWRRAIAGGIVSIGCLAGRVLIGEWGHREPTDVLPCLFTLIPFFLFSLLLSTIRNSFDSFPCGFPPRDLLGSIDQMIYVYYWHKTSGGRVISLVSANCDQYFGVSAGQVLDPSFSFPAHVHPDDYPEMDRIARVCHTQGGLFETNMRILKEGSSPGYHWVRNKASMIGDSDTEQTWLGTYEDISDLIDIQNECGRLREQARCLEGVMSIVFSRWFYVDKDTKIRSAVPTAEEGQNFADCFVLDDEQQRFLRSLDRSLGNYKASTVDTECSRSAPPDLIEADLRMSSVDPVERCHVYVVSVPFKQQALIGLRWSYMAGESESSSSFESGLIDIPLTGDIQSLLGYVLTRLPVNYRAEFAKSW